MGNRNTTTTDFKGRSASNSRATLLSRKSALLSQSKVGDECQINCNSQDKVG